MDEHSSKNQGPRRILVVGVSGSGKTTYAKTLAERMGVPHIEIDSLYWGAHWRANPREEFLRQIEQIAQGEAWVIEGHFGKTRPIVLPRAESIVWLDCGFPRAFGRLLSRTFQRARSGETLWNGNRESWRRTLMSRESPLWWLIKDYRARVRDFEKYATVRQKKYGLPLLGKGRPYLGKHSAL